MTNTIENIPAAYYKTLLDKTSDVINIIKDFFLSENMSKYRHLTEENICNRENILFLSDKFKKYNITKESYIKNGYLLKNGSRVIFLDLDKKFGTATSFAFPYVANINEPDNVKIINVFIINTAINQIEDQEEKDIIIIRTLYRVIKVYFLTAMMSEPDSVIYKSARTFATKNVIIDRNHQYEEFTANTIYYVDFLISVIRVIDTFLDLKFSDMNYVKKAITWFDRNNVLDNVFGEIYDYAIDMYPDSKDYFAIFEKLDELNVDVEYFF